MLAYYVAAFISASALTSGSAGVLAFPDHGGHRSSGGGGYDNHPKPYGFEYGVHDSYSGASFDQHENSDGKVVSGSYTVQLPDGRKQVRKLPKIFFNLEKL